MSRLRVIIITAAVLSASILPSHADIYKYRDEKGVVHFTNIPDGEGYSKIISEEKAVRPRPVKRPSSRSDYDHIIVRNSRKYNVEPSIIKAVITAESNWDPVAVSKEGAMGLMQLMPETARDMLIHNPFNPEDNIEGGTKYLRFLLDKFKEDLDLALAAYNAGPSTVEKSGGIPPIQETRKYVKKVTDMYKGTSGGKPVRIYKVTYDDGTVLYTNTPFPYSQQKLSKF